MGTINKAFLIPDWWEILIPILACRTRILMVADNSGGFGPSAFGLGEAVSVVKAASSPFYPIEVTTASTATATADVTNFRFDGTHSINGENRNINDYEEIWLFGFLSSDSGMTGSQLDAIIDFMDQGGGVFATGDHDNLGGAMCGEIPRVKSMRHWYTNVAPPGAGTNRLDTNVPSPGANPQFDLQSDNIPQRIYPVWKSRNDEIPHPLLSFPGGTVTYLPDHPHEGRCVVPSQLNLTEWPEDPNGNQTRPELVAYGVSGGPGFRPDKPSISPPELFGVIGAYDGHRANIGRVVVDSTWHHWININLNGAGAEPLTGGVPVNGLYDENGNPTPEYLQIQSYYQNIATWLKPLNARRCGVIFTLPMLRFEWPLWEEIDIDRIDDIEHIIQMGEITEKLLADRFGAAMPLEVIEVLSFDMGKTGRRLQELLNVYPSEKKKLRLPALLDESKIRASILGGAVLAFGSKTPMSKDAQSTVEKIIRKKAKSSVNPFTNILADGAIHGMSLLNKEIANFSQDAQGFMNRLKL